MERNGRWGDDVKRTIMESSIGDRGVVATGGGACKLCQRSRSYAAGTQYCCLNDPVETLDLDANEYCSTPPTEQCPTMMVACGTFGHTWLMGSRKRRDSVGCPCRGVLGLSVVAASAAVSVALPTGVLHTGGECTPDAATARAMSGGSDAPVARLGTMVLSLPLNPINVVAILVLLAFSCLGCVFLWKLVTRRKCNCKLCSGDYTIKSVIGSGGYGQVFTVVRRSDNQLLVLKKIGVDDITDANFAQAEAHELRALSHTRIVGYEDDFVHVEWTQGLTGAMELEPMFFLGIVMEYCPEGDLSDRIAAAHGRSISSGESDEDEDDLAELPEKLQENDHKPVITEAQILTWLSQMSEALAFIHEQNIIHRDIKSQNFFLKKNSVQLGDFGLCRRAVTQTITVGGTDVYMAPEMVLGKRYGKEADVWAMGCVLFEMCTGRFMWEIPGILGAQTAASQQATQKLLNVVPRGYSGGLRTLLGCLLRASPRERPSAAEVFSSLHLNAAAQASEGGAKASQVEIDIDSIIARTRSVAGDSET